MRFDPNMFLRGYNPTPIEPESNALLRGIQMQGARQGNALNALKLQAAQQQMAEQAQAAQRQQAIEGAYRNALETPLDQAGAAGMTRPTPANAAAISQMQPRLNQQRLAQELMPIAPMEAAKLLTPQPRKLMNVGPGGSVIDESGKVVYRADFKPEPAKLPAIGELQAYRDGLPPGDPRRREVQALIDNQTRAPKAAGSGAPSPAAVIEAGGENQMQLAKLYGKAAPGYRWKADGSQEPIPGGPADRKNTDAGIREQRQREASVAQASRVIAKVDEALEKVGYTSAGIGAAVTNLPGTTTRDLQTTLETIKANLGFAELQAMRDASPTGGALGAIAVQELNALQATVASLDQSQSPQRLRESLNDIRKHYGKWRDAVQQSGGEQPAAPPAPGKPAAPAAGAAARTATNPKTGEKLQLVNGQWVPLK